jgi:APA family basic amino acid/polyamine antiporter
VFGIWVVAVLVWYFTYGIRHSRLRAGNPRKDMS